MYEEGPEAVLLRSIWRSAPCGSKRRHDAVAALQEARRSPSARGSRPRCCLQVVCVQSGAKAHRAAGALIFDRSPGTGRALGNGCETPWSDSIDPIRSNAVRSAGRRHIAVNIGNGLVEQACDRHLLAPVRLFLVSTVVGELLLLVHQDIVPIDEAGSRCLEPEAVL